MPETAVTISTPAGVPLYHGRLLGPGDAIDLGHVTWPEPVLCVRFAAMPARPSRLVDDPAICGGSPVVRGTWISAAYVAEMVRRGWTWAEIRNFHREIEDDDIRACLEYAIASGDAR